ncbi:hypothetical protein GOBAR_AA19757 [Gossypium barbadense]|uniref:Uncharacterized protein n=1 Tax=Gossypium barbadense TaxID=3634 RepID=A0A2P5XC56_GOSBA|nr:hypothetical protein GOBAR_AA19757 [Gossypium barbadense]
MAQALPKGGLLRLPPKLCRKSPKPIPGSNRYAFFRGRNLLDKEFCYLRTVIVTTAVHWGFSLRLPCHQVRHWVGINPHTWSYDFVDTCVFGKQSPRPDHCDPLCDEAPRELSLALGILYLPTCASFEYSLLCPPGPTRGSTGIFICCLSTTPFGLILGPDSSSVDDLAEEPLGFLGIRFSPMFALLKPTFSFSLHLLPFMRVLPPKAELSPIDVLLHPTASADRLASFIFGARALDQ